jgi:4-hydroxy-tetrahydrodipicolinate reductase
MIKLGLLGATGRMGQWITRLVHGEFSDRLELVAQISSTGRPSELLKADVVIDFSNPVAMMGVARTVLAQSGKVPCFVIGSTGWTPEQRQTLEELSRKTPVVMSANFSLGVQVLLSILRHAAPKLLELGYEPVLVESHHKHKKDAPSGTALAILNAVSKTGHDQSPLQVHSIRAGEIIGDHEVTFHGPGDHVVIGHFAQDRSIFARGALEAALWLASKPQTPGAPVHGGVLGLDAFLREKLPL